MTDNTGCYPLRVYHYAKWLGELRAIVTHAELPVLTIAASMRDPDALLSSLGRGRRARTLRRRCWD